MVSLLDVFFNPNYVVTHILVVHLSSIYRPCTEKTSPVVDDEAGPNRSPFWRQPQGAPRSNTVPFDAEPLKGSTWFNWFQLPETQKL